MTVLPHTFTVLSSIGRERHIKPRSVTGAVEVPLTADSESRVPAEVRRVSWDMVERFPWLAPVEALCHFGGTRVSVESEPGIILLDQRFPIWLAVLNDRAFLSIDTDLLEGAARTRFQVATEYLAFLAGRGYIHLFDHRTRTWHRADGSANDFVGRLTAGATTRRFDELRTDWRFGFLGGFLAYFLIDVAMNAQTARPWWTSVVKGLVLGSFVNGIQYFQARRALAARLRQLREEILSAKERAEHLTFRKRAKTVWGEIFGTLFVGTIATGALFEDPWANFWIGLPVFCLFGLLIWSLLVSRHVYVVLDWRAIEGLAMRRRIRIPYVDVDGIRQSKELGFTRISSAHQSIWIPNYLEHYLQLVDVVWDRVSSAVPESAAPLIHGRTERPTRFQSILQDARQSVDFIWPVLRASWPHVWIHLFERRNPLRRQYGWHPHLLRHGRVVLGLVINAEEVLWQEAREQHVVDGAALVLFAPDLAVDDAGELLEQVVARVWDDTDNDDEDVEDFRSMLDEQAPYPLAVAVPESLTRGTRVLCSSLMVVRRYVPLGRLRSPWVPLLIDPSACPFATVLPARYWDPLWRQSWNTFDVQAADTDS